VERNGLGRREKQPEKNREKGEQARKGRRKNINFLKLVIIVLDNSPGSYVEKALLLTLF